MTAQGRSSPSLVAPASLPDSGSSSPTSSPVGLRGAIGGKPPFKPVESPLVAGAVRGLDGKARSHKKRSNSDVGESMDRVATLAQQSLDRIRVLEADGQLRREHAKKIEHKLDEHARVQLRLEESLQRIYDLLSHGDGGASTTRRSSRSSRQGSDVGGQRSASKNSVGSASDRGDASPGRDGERRNSDGRATTRDDSRGRTVRKRVPIISSDSQTGAREAEEAKAAEQRALSL